VFKVPDGLIDDRLAEEGANRQSAFADESVKLTGSLRKFRLIIDLLRGDLDTAEPSGSPLACSDYQEILIAALLEGWPGRRQNISVTNVSPRSVRQAVDYIHAHAEEEIRVNDLAKAAGASTTMLFDAFRNHMNCGPLAYVRAVRLRSARSAITNRDDPRSVTEIALDCGFLHLGRFSILFRTAYGETPSQARRRVRH
jgi:AraC-like DNA-binding protein